MGADATQDIELDFAQTIALDIYVGCPHCGGPVDVSASVARACREMAELVFDRLNDGALAIELLHPLELTAFEYANYALSCRLDPRGRCKSWPAQVLERPSP